jgi:hypothetical protein
MAVIRPYYPKELLISRSYWGFHRHILLDFLTPSLTLPAMITFSEDHLASLTGAAGSLLVLPNDEITLKLAMLFEGDCEGLGPLKAADKFGYSKQRYFQLRHLFQEQGAIALQSKPTGPQSNYRRTDEVVRQIIRHRFLDPEVSPEVIAQKLAQTDHAVSIRSVQRTIADYGLQKKTLRS